MRLTLCTRQKRFERNKKWPSPPPADQRSAHQGYFTSRKAVNRVTDKINESSGDSPPPPPPTTTSVHLLRDETSAIAAIIALQYLSNTNISVMQSVLLVKSSVTVSLKPSPYGLNVSQGLLLVGYSSTSAIGSVRHMNLPETRYTLEPNEFELDVEVDMHPSVGVVSATWLVSPLPTCSEPSPPLLPCRSLVQQTTGFCPQARSLCPTVSPSS